MEASANSYGSGSVTTAAAFIDDDGWEYVWGFMPKKIKDFLWPTPPPHR